MKAFEDEKLNVTKMMISVYDRIENTDGKGDGWSPVFSPFPTMFSEGLEFMVVKNHD